MQLANSLELLRQAAVNLTAAYREVARAHRGETEVVMIAGQLAARCEEQAEAVGPFVRRYQGTDPDGPDWSPSARFTGPRGPGAGLLRDLQELYLMAAECDIGWTVLERCAEGARDTELLGVVRRCHADTRIQLAWLRTQLTQAAVQALVVA